MKVSYAYRLLRNEVGGSPSLGFSERDAYNSVANKVKRTLDGGGCQPFDVCFRS